jgi:hypothetical protein
MSTSTVLTIVAIFALGAGALLVLRLDSNKIATLAVQRAPRRSPLLTPISVVVPGAAVGVVGIVCAFTVVSLYRPGGVVAQRDLAAFETVAEAARASTGFASLSDTDYFESLAKVAAAYKPRTFFQASVRNENLASSVTTPRAACAKMFELVSQRIASAPGSKLSDTEEALIQYCLPHLK